MEHAEGSVIIEAPLEDVMEVIEDYESYPEWSEVQTVDVKQRGHRAHRVGDTQQEAGDSARSVVVLTSQH